MTILLPNKYEKLSENTIITGAKIISLLKKQKYSVEDLYQILKKERQINLERFYNTISFLWVTEVIITDDYYISLKK